MANDGEATKVSAARSANGSLLGASESSPTSCDCSVCGQDHPFDLPQELLTAALGHKLVVFAGAGISTESRRAMGDTFADRVAMELGEPIGGRTFPQLMTAYEGRFGRPQLLQRIRSRFDYIKGFPELHRSATRFHKELATAYFLDQIVTTNWDTYFEEFAGASPIVIPADYAFWDLSGRTVFKLHGSMHNLGTLVATENDYARCYRQLQRNTIGSTLKHLLATKRVVFIGYSFGDSDLAGILAFMRRELGDLLPRSFVVTPHGYSGKDFPPERVIATDGAYFIRKLKDAAVAAGHMRPDTIYDKIGRLADRVARARHRAASRFHVDKDPSAIYTWAYQDGLLHAFERVEALKPTGHYSDPHAGHGVIAHYEAARKGAIRTRQYFDAAYINGYQNGLLALDFDEETTHQMPLYFVWGSDSELVEFGEFKRELRNAPQLHKGANDEARRLVQKAGGLVPVHTPFLDVDGLAAASRSTRKWRDETASS